MIHPHHHRYIKKKCYAMMVVKLISSFLFSKASYTSRNEIILFFRKYYFFIKSTSFWIKSTRWEKETLQQKRILWKKVWILTSTNVSANQTNRFQFGNVIGQVRKNQSFVIKLVKKILSSKMVWQTWPVMSIVAGSNKR